MSNLCSTGPEHVLKHMSRLWRARKNGSSLRPNSTVVSIVLKFGLELKQKPNKNPRKKSSPGDVKGPTVTVSHLSQLSLRPRSPYVANAEWDGLWMGRGFFCPQRDHVFVAFFLLFFPESYTWPVFFFGVKTWDASCFMFIINIFFFVCWCWSCVCCSFFDKLYDERFLSSGDQSYDKLWCWCSSHELRGFWQYQRGYVCSRSYVIWCTMYYDLIRLYTAYEYIWDCAFDLIYMNRVRNVSGWLWAEKTIKGKTLINLIETHVMFGFPFYIISLCTSCSSSALNSETFAYWRHLQLPSLFAQLFVFYMGIITLEPMVSKGALRFSDRNDNKTITISTARTVFFLGVSQTVVAPWF